MNSNFLKTILTYKDGLLYWKVSHNGVTAGQLAGTPGMYWRVHINHKKYSAHRLIFMYHHNYLPKFIDHIDRNKLNNKIENLRPVSISQNGGNMSLPKNNKTGYKGVCVRDGKFRTCFRGRDIGSFKTAKEAAEAYNKASLDFYGDFARLNILKE